MTNENNTPPVWAFEAYDLAVLGGYTTQDLAEEFCVTKKEMAAALKAVERYERE